jgi:thiol-disulfide isomerase/thioredoxin
MLVAAIVGTGVFAACGGDDDGSDDGADGDAASGATFERFDGEEVTLADYAGRPLVVNFFANWCPPCVTEMPAFEEVNQQYGDEVAFLGISVNESVEEAQALVDRTGVTYDLAREPQGNLVRELGGVGMPTTVLLTADGEVVEAHTGELSGDELTELIEAELLS